MKELRGKMRLIGTLIVCLFIGLGAWYGYTVYSEGSVWASSPYNTRSNGTTAHMGDITDRDGNLLAHTASDGTRQYLTNESSRRALSQTIGDQMGMSGTGVENYYSSRYSTSPARSSTACARPFPARSASAPASS